MLRPLNHPGIFTETAKPMLLFPAVNLDCLMGKVRGAFSSGFVNVFGHAVTGDIHLPQTPENLLGAGIVMLCDEALQLGYQCLGFAG